jgi:hypothetical protein
MSKLVDGLIPKGTVCPFKEECNLYPCEHHGTEHKVDYSCALARGFDIIHESKKRKENG